GGRRRRTRRRDHAAHPGTPGDASLEAPRAQLRSTHAPQGEAGLVVLRRIEVSGDELEAIAEGGARVGFRNPGFPVEARVAWPAAAYRLGGTMHDFATLVGGPGRLDVGEQASERGLVRPVGG